MKTDFKLLGLSVSLVCIPVLMALPQSFLVSDVALSQQSPDQGGPEGERRMPLFGKITAVHSDSIEITNASNETVVVKLTSQTEFRRDRQPAKRSDFKVGDVIAVRGEQNPDHTWTAQMIGARSLNGEGRGPNIQAGTLGKDYVTGEVKSIDPPKISVLRTDHVSQTIELNEDTSMRRGRDSITMSDIQPGDHLVARGAIQDNVFVPKFVMVIGPEQWKRMQEMGGMGGGMHQGGGRGTPPANPPADSPAQKPPESPH
jgi:uncharacterized protein DUF5666